MGLDELCLGVLLELRSLLELAEESKEEVLNTILSSEICRNLSILGCRESILIFFFSLKDSSFRFFIGFLRVGVENFSENFSSNSPLALVSSVYFRVTFTTPKFRFIGLSLTIQSEVVGILFVVFGWIS